MYEDLSTKQQTSSPQLSERTGTSVPEWPSAIGIPLRELGLGCHRADLVCRNLASVACQSRLSINIYLNGWSLKRWNLSEGVHGFRLQRFTPKDWHLEATEKTFSIKIISEDWSASARVAFIIIIIIIISLLL